MLEKYELCFSFFDAKIVDEILENENSSEVNIYREF
jgi:hypothetical protein